MSKTKRTSTKTPANGQTGPVIRIAKLKSPAGREVLERVTRDGRLSRRAQELLGIKRVKEFVVVQAISWAQAFSEIGAKLRQKVRDPQHQSIFLRADEDVPFGAFATVMDAVKGSGISNVSIVTQPLSQGARASSR